MGPDLYKPINLVGMNNLTKNTIYRNGNDLLYNIKMLHNKGYLHWDLKLDHIVSLLEPIIIDNYSINFIIIDFGFSFQFKYKTWKLIEHDIWLKQKCGNSYFESIDAFEEKHLEAKDELFSICYILLSLILKDKLRWKYIKKVMIVIQKKETMQIKKKSNYNWR